MTPFFTSGHGLLVWAGTAALRQYPLDRGTCPVTATKKRYSPTKVRSGPTLSSQSQRSRRLSATQRNASWAPDRRTSSSAASESAAARNSSLVNTTAARVVFAAGLCSWVAHPVKPAGRRGTQCDSPVVGLGVVGRAGAAPRGVGQIVQLARHHGAQQALQTPDPVERELRESHIRNTLALASSVMHAQSWPLV
jgi:hypothetical protein